MVKVPESILQKLNGRYGGSTINAEDDIIAAQRRQVEKATNADFVTQKKGLFSVENKMRRKAVREALEARLSIFRDNIESIRTANRVMNNAAIIQVMNAAENFITQVRKNAEIEKQDILYHGQEELMLVLSQHLNKLSTMRQNGILPDEIIEAQETGALNDFANRSMKIAGLDFEFDKSKLLKIA